MLVAFLEVAINRVAVPMLRPAKGTPPTWHTLLDYSGLFLFYFAGTLAAVLIGVRIVEGLRRSRTLRDWIANGALAVATLLAAIPLVLAAGEPGKEILHPVAVVIVGGLVSSTLLDLVVTPAIFYAFGRKAAEKALRLEAPAAQ